MSVTLVQRRTGTGTTSVSASGWTTPAAGNLIAIAIAANDTGLFPNGSGWTQLSNLGIATTAGVQIFAKIADGTETTISASNSFATVMRCMAVELAGTVNTSLAAAIDKNTGDFSGGGAASATLVTGTLATASEYIMVANGWTNTSSSTYSGGVTGRFNDARMGAADAITTVTTSLSVTDTFGTSRPWQMVLASFKASITNPTITTTAASALTETTGTGAGNVTANGDSLVTERGVVISTSTNPPTIANTKFAAGSGFGSFTVPMTGLVAGTTYYYRAYATNKAGTAYGTMISFTTPSGFIPRLITI